MDRYDTRIARGNINEGEASTIRAEHPELTTLAHAIQKAHNGTIESRTLHLYHLIGLLRYEANKMEEEYIRRMERSEKEVEDIDEKEMFGKVSKK